MLRTIFIQQDVVIHGRLLQEMQSRHAANWNINLGQLVVRLHVSFGAQRKL